MSARSPQQRSPQSMRASSQRAPPYVLSVTGSKKRTQKKNQPIRAFSSQAFPAKRSPVPLKPFAATGALKIATTGSAMPQLGRRTDIAIVDQTPPSISLCCVTHFSPSFLSKKVSLSLTSSTSTIATLQKCTASRFLRDSRHGSFSQCERETPGFARVDKGHRAVKGQSGITRFARPSALIPFPP